MFLATRNNLRCYCAVAKLWPYSVPIFYEDNNTAEPAFHAEGGPLGLLPVPLAQLGLGYRTGRSERPRRSRPYTAQPALLGRLVYLR
jgi:hypothetical protein